MDFKLLLSPEALSDLESIVAYIAPHDAGAAERMENHPLDAGPSLNTFPERGRKVPEEKVIKPDKSVAEGIKYVISLGAILPGCIRVPGPDFKEVPAALPSSAGHD